MFLSVLIIVTFSIAYAGVHSLLASQPVKNGLRRMLGPGVERWYRLVYNIFSGITLLPIFPILALLPDQTLYVTPAPWRWLMVLGQLLALLGLGVALLQTNPLHFLGLTQLLTGQSGEPDRLIIHGFYRWVRHPLYLFSLLFLWLTPFMTVNLLVTYILFTLYFYIGSIHEERRLLAEFGPAYQAYCEQVPRLLPWPGHYKRFQPDSAACLAPTSPPTTLDRG